MLKATENGNTLKVIIVGGGLVGSLSACYFGKHGHEVHLYEYRDDIRKSQLSSGRSINLALSHRGRAALKEVGLEDIVLQHGIPMTGRMIHGKDGSLSPIPYDPVYHQVIYSVSRKKLNETLLAVRFLDVLNNIVNRFYNQDIFIHTWNMFQMLMCIHRQPFSESEIGKWLTMNAHKHLKHVPDAEKYPKVTMHFRCKLVSADLEAGVARFLQCDNNEQFTDTADLIVGADGVHSAVRKEMLKRPMFNFSQTYIEHGYLELCIPPNGYNDFAMARNYLHIWPRGTFMMIALPNQDASWTVTLFMPFRTFSLLDSPTVLLKFFDCYFPDGLSLIGKDRLINDFFATKPSPLLSVKCNPYHVTDKAVLIGDAAHGMVPFYGQGMNAGFEDCRILDSLLVNHVWNLETALSKYSETRNPDAEAICDLALYNYVEMRDLVTRRLFLVRKYVDNLLYRLLPGTWMPLYNSVTFSHMPYRRCVHNKLRHDKILTGIAAMTSVAVTAGLVIIIYRWHSRFPLRHICTFMYEKLMI